MDKKQRHATLILVGILTIACALLVLVRCDTGYKNDVKDGAFILTAKQVTDTFNAKAADKFPNFKAAGDATYTGEEMTLAYTAEKEGGVVSSVSLTGKLDSEEHMKNFSGCAGILMVVMDNNLREEELGTLIEELAFAKAATGDEEIHTQYQYNQRLYRFDRTGDSAAFTVTAQK
ncbi:hypothetical protein [Bittarella massiliensis (ex Durand et al. 2017)]|uniref:hypothetical protein n=1 Tax=Bittarella massiliensis (ex Durand et al. 2017) TaxID=1720313 RepID=UPI001AA12344|nr:hypothetical protein [Bittarella massiliensis (ex Durand et al. 2017)]MBO1679679.1 hypothetical protein [Bittarella massiliensis (ex Durand et al. 2017)]